MSALLTRCTWCGESQADNLDDVCTSCKQEGYLMDYKVQLCGECEGDGCTKCTAFCGDCLTPLENCGCKP